VDNKAFRSILGHAIAGLVAGIGLLLTGWVSANPDPVSWTLADFKIAAFVAGVAALKKFVAGELTGTN
jgi:uncharacterized membrane protein